MVCPIDNTIVINLIKNSAYLVTVPNPEFDGAFRKVLNRWGALEKKNIARSSVA